MTGYHIALTMERSLTAQEISDLREKVADPVADVELDGEDVVLVRLDSEDSVTAWKDAMAFVQEATSVPASSFQVLP